MTSRDSLPWFREMVARDQTFATIATSSTVWNVAADERAPMSRTPQGKNLPPKFELQRVKGARVTDAELLGDLRSVAEQLGRESVPQKTYRQQGKYDDTTLIGHFGSWNAALRAAGLAVSNEVGLPDERLFANVLALWQHYGRQPRRSELAVPPSSVSQSPYLRRFGSWGAALEAFVAFANSTEAEVPPIAPNPEGTLRKTGRDPSMRLRFRVLQRDRFTCQGCGASPAKTAGVELHVDHVIPWSKGGETTQENLKTLCSTCNLGKSDLDPIPRR